MDYFLGPVLEPLQLFSLWGGYVLYLCIPQWVELSTCRWFGLCENQCISSSKPACLFSRQLYLLLWLYAPWKWGSCSEWCLDVWHRSILEFTSCRSQLHLIFLVCLADPNSITLVFSHWWRACLAHTRLSGSLGPSDSLPCCLDVLYFLPRCKLRCHLQYFWGSNTVH